MPTVRVRFDGKVLIPQEPVDLPTDRELHAEVSDLGDRLPDELRPGSPDAISRVLNSLTPISHDSRAAFEQALAEGHLPVNDRGAFDEG